MSTRREFITVMGGAAAWPVAARAQPAERVRRIGVLMSFSAETIRKAPGRAAAFTQGLGQLSWTVGQTARKRSQAAYEVYSTVRIPCD
jgi:putative ABC transport system substrate-binding protein